jgi:SAM-dependent methyltransferase
MTTSDLTGEECSLLRRLDRTPELFDEIAAAAGPELNTQAQLRQRYPAELVRAAFELAELRRRAAEKFSRADRMWFDRQGLEQATSEAVARHKAARFGPLHTPVWDLCCGIGGDSIALAEVGSQVFGVDLSPVNCLRTEMNARTYGVESRVETRSKDVTRIDLAGLPVHIDPDRRTGRKRAVRLEDYHPALEFLHHLIEVTSGGAIKLSPASNFGGKFPGCEIELISLHGECKEATVWYGDLKGEAPFRATILPAGETLAADPWQFRPRVGPLGAYLFDPDPAVVRAGLVDALAEQLGLWRLDDTEEYLTGEQPVSSSAVKPFEVLADLPNNARQIRGYFRSSEFGEVEIKCRHVPADVEQIRKKLPLPGSEKGVLLLARLAGRTRALIARRIPITVGRP